MNVEIIPILVAISDWFFNNTYWANISFCLSCTYVVTFIICQGQSDRVLVSGPGMQINSKVVGYLI